MTTPTIAVPRLRIFRELDVNSLSEEFIDAITKAEGTLPYVDADRPRDYPLTEEILENTVAAILVDPDGQVLGKFDGPEGWLAAEKAKSTARVTFDISVDTDAKPRRRGRRPADDQTDDSEGE